MHEHHTYVYIYSRHVYIYELYITAAQGGQSGVLKSARNLVRCSSMKLFCLGLEFSESFMMTSLNLSMAFQSFFPSSNSQQQWQGLWRRVLKLKVVIEVFIHQLSCWNSKGLVWLFFFCQTQLLNCKILYSLTLFFLILQLLFSSCFLYFQFRTSFWSNSNHME